MGLEQGEWGEVVQTLPRGRAAGLGFYTQNGGSPGGRWADAGALGRPLVALTGRQTGTAMRGLTPVRTDALWWLLVGQTGREMQDPTQWCSQAPSGVRCGEDRLEKGWSRT